MAETLVRNCLGCGKTDDSPRDVVGLATNDSANWHMDCHYMVAGCKVCWAVLQTAGGHGPDGLKNDDLHNHFDDLDARKQEEIFTHPDAQRYAHELHKAAPRFDVTSAVFETVEANKIWGAVVGQTVYVATVAPIMLRLFSVIGSDTATGTQDTGGSYAPQAVTTWGTPASRAITNVTAPAFNLMPAITTVAAEGWDSAGTPLRKFWGALAANKVTASGDTLSFAANSITLTLG